MARGVVLIVVDAENNHQIWSLGRCGDDDLLCPGREMLRGVLSLCEEAGRFEDDVHAELAPRESGGVALGQDGERSLSNLNRIAVNRHTVRQVAEDRVVLQEVGQRIRGS